MAKGDESLCSHDPVRAPIPPKETFAGYDIYHWEARAMRETRLREKAQACIERLEEEREEVKALALGVGEWGAFDDD